MRAMFCLLGTVLLLASVLKVEGKVPLYMIHRKDASNRTVINDYSLESYIQLLENNAGLLTEPAKNPELLANNKVGINVFRPLGMSYLFAIQTSNADLAAKFALERETPSFYVEVDQEEQALESIFSLKNPKSLASKAVLAHAANDTFHVFTDDAQTVKNLEGISVFPMLESTGSLYTVDTSDWIKHIANENVEECLNSEFKRLYAFHFDRKKVYKYNTNVILELSEENQAKLSLYFQDLCSILMVPNMIQRNKKVITFGFALKSLAALEESRFGVPEMEMIYDMLRITIKKFQKKMDERLSGSDVVGHALLFDAKKNSQGSNLAQFIEVNGQQAKHRVLAENLGYKKVGDTNNNQILYWYGLGFFIMLAWVLTKLFTEEQPKDTLLYAKFLTTDSGPGGR